jgi:decaprenylphospho-beta-D-erythro-pentofuranosid-2-ulose 2-reductase
MRILIVGATSAIAKECARTWAYQAPNHEFILVGRDQEKLDGVAADLKARNPHTKVTVIANELTDPVKVAKVGKAISEIGDINVALIAQGELPIQRAVELSPKLLHQTITVNATSVALYTELAAHIMERQGYGTLAVIGSVAGDRGRKSNYTYGATKAFLATFTAGLMHRFAGTGVQISLIKPGPTDTPMTTGLKNVADVRRVAQDIVNGLAARKSVIYTPGLWRWIMLVVRAIPAGLFHKINL